MKRIYKLLVTFIRRTKKIFKWSRIRKFGFYYTFLEFLILLCHRSNSKFEHFVTRKKDEKINRYLIKYYGEIINEYYSKK